MGIFYRDEQGYLYFVADSADEVPPSDEQTLTGGYYFFWDNVCTWRPPAQWIFQSELDEREYEHKDEEEAEPEGGDEKNTKRRRHARDHPSGFHGSARMDEVVGYVNSNSNLGGATTDAFIGPCHGPQIGPQPPPQTKPVAAETRRLVEVGAGGGEYSAYLKRYFNGYEMIATDISSEAGERGWLLHAAEAGITTKYGVDANALEQHFEPSSIDVIVSVGCYGVGPKQPGASYGLARCTGRMVKASKRKRQQGSTTRPETETDLRFLQSAHAVLKEGGFVVMLVRNNMLFDWAASAAFLHRELSAHNLRAANEERPKLTTTNVYADIPLASLSSFADLGYEITVTPTTPPAEVKFRAIDSAQDTELFGFNVQIIFTKSAATGVKACLVAQPFWATLPPLLVAAPAEVGPPPYRTFSLDEIPGDNNCFFHAIAHYVGVPMAQVREDLADELAGKLFEPPYGNGTQLRDDVLSGVVKPADVPLQDTPAAQAIVARYAEVTAQWPSFPPLVAQYVAQLPWTADDVEKLRKDEQFPGRPNTTIWGENILIHEVASERYQRPVIIFAEYERGLQMVSDTRHLRLPDGAAPMHLFYDGNVHFTVIQFNVDPASIVDGYDEVA